MKRSEINAVIEQAEADFERAGFALPGFGRWTPEQWRTRGEAAAPLAATGLGWDVTDFAEGRFERKGLLLFTLRNGSPSGGAGHRPYAEKIMISRRDQLTPMHRHAAKVEDIINRSSLSSGARLAIKLFAMGEDGGLARGRKVVTHRDGITGEVEAGAVLELRPGDSITLFPGTFHAFWGEGGDVVVGEVSTVNDDVADNVFAEPLSRFTAIDEDHAPYRLLVTDYAGLPGAAGGAPRLDR